MIPFLYNKEEKNLSQMLSQSEINIEKKTNKYQHQHIS
jgi:hypothetical protein